jgi:hypothetical protein
MSKTYVIVDDITNQPIGLFIWESEDQQPAFGGVGQHIVDDEDLLVQFTAEVAAKRAARAAAISALDQLG